MSNSSRLLFPSRQYQAGFSLVELMVTLAISSFLMLGVVKIFTSTKVIFHTQEGISQIQENQRVALDHIIRDVSSAGYMGCLQATADKITNTLETKNSVDDPVNGYLYELENPIDGIEGDADPDTLIIRRASEGVAIPLKNPMDSQTDTTLEVDENHPNFTAENWQQWDIAVLSDCANAVVFLITNDPHDAGNLGVIEHNSGTPVPPNTQFAGQQNAAPRDFGRIFGSAQSSIAKIYKVGASKYYIAQSTTGNGKSLYVDSGRRFELIEGVEDFQVQYGIDSGLSASNPTPSSYVDADEVPNWSNVVSIKVTLTLATLEPVGNNVEADGRLRKTVSATLRVRNRSPG